MATWPNKHPFAATLSFDFDAESVWIGENPDNANRPGVLSQGRYGPKVAIPLILDLLAHHEVTATFYVPAIDAIHHPEAVQAVVDAGHEIAHHGYTHTNPTELSPEQERAELFDGLEVLERFGTKVTGYRSPSWEFTPHTLDLLQEAGLSYSSNLLDHILPYAHTTHDLIEVPVAWILDDAPHFWFANDTWEKTIRSPKEVLDVWLPEIDGIAQLGGHAMLTFHPFITGRPSRLRFLDTLITHLKEHNAWIATTQEIVDHTRAHGPFELRRKEH